MSLGPAVKMAAEDLARGMAQADRAINDMLKGQRVRITSEYNGQLVGTSRPSLRGRTFTVQHACYDNDTVVLFLDGPRHLSNSVTLGEVEVL